jgi:hypothetical protein
MPRSRNRPKPKSQGVKRRRWDWRRAAGGWAEFLRNFALVFMVSPFVDPLLSGAPLNAERAAIGLAMGVVLLVASSILDNERRD